MSARNWNFGIAMRERERRIARGLEDPYDTGAQGGDFAGDAFWGSLREAGERANAAGMGFRADLSGIGRDGGIDPGLVGGLNPLERQAQKDAALQRQFSADTDAAWVAKQTQDAVTGARRDQLIDDAKASEMERGVNEAFADPSATRQQVMQRLPPSLRDRYAQQWAAQDAARLTAEAKMAEAKRDDSPLVAVMGPNGRSVLVPRSVAAGMQPASGREQGRPVTSGDAGRIADFDTSLDDVLTLRNTLQETKGATGTGAKIGAMLPNVVTDLTGWGTEPKQRQAVIDRVKQVIGKALEGGVLRKEDETKYEKILPTIGDSAEVAASKMNGLEAALRQRRQTLVDSLQDAGYEVGGYNTRSPHGRTGDAGKGGNAKDPLGIR